MCKTVERGRRGFCPQLLDACTQSDHVSVQMSYRQDLPDAPISTRGGWAGRGWRLPSPMNACPRLDLKQRGGSGAHTSTPASSSRPSKRSFGASSPVVALCKTSSRTRWRPTFFSPWSQHPSFTAPDQPMCAELRLSQTPGLTGGQCRIFSRTRSAPTSRNLTMHGAAC
jgi:hypothetical protein